MRNRTFWQALVRRVRRVWHYAIGASTRTNPPRKHDNSVIDPRARFWAEFREGQREADARVHRRS